MKEKILPVWRHIEELRKHIIRSLIAIVIATIILMQNKYFIFDYILFGPVKNNFFTYRIISKLSFFFSYSNLFNVFRKTFRNTK
nr:twin-arginine translocase subunit TatC [Blattabacterium cuenoti]